MLFITREEELHRDLPLQSLYFYAIQSPYHKKFLTMIDQIEAQYKDMPFFAVDVMQFEVQYKRFSVDSVPTVIVLRDGKEINRTVGLVSTSTFKSFFADIYKEQGENNV